MSLSHLKITQAGLVALFTTVVGQVVAFVPAFGPDKQTLISAGSTVIAAAFMLANAGHKLADSNVSAGDVKAGAIAAARSEIGRVNFDALVQDAVNAKSLPDIEAMAEAKARQVLASLLGQAAQSAPALTQAPPVGPVAAGGQPPALTPIK